MRTAFLIVAFVLALSLPSTIHAQSNLDVPRYELGLQLNFAYLNGVGA